MNKIMNTRRIANAGFTNPYKNNNHTQIWIRMMVGSLLISDIEIDYRLDLSFVSILKLSVNYCLYVILSYHSSFVLSPIMRHPMGLLLLLIFHLPCLFLFFFSTVLR